MKCIKLTKNKRAIVDDEDYPYLSRFSWHLSSKNWGRPITYFTSEKNEAIGISMSRFLMTKHSKHRIIYKNKNQLDNRKENLVSAPVSVVAHLAEKKKGMSSKHKGVCYKKRDKKWYADINKNGKRIALGSFQNEKEAALAYNEKAKELYGEFSYQNKI